jgi:hypothetical protein
LGRLGVIVLIGCWAIAGCASEETSDRIGEIPSGAGVCVEHPSGTASGELCLRRVDGQLRVEASGLEPLAPVTVVDDDGNSFESEADLDGSIDVDVTELVVAPYRATSVWDAAGIATLGTGTEP